MVAATEWIRDEIIRRIVEGELAPGERLPEVALAADLGVSRTPVREALRVLATQGYVAIVPQKGAVVGSWSPPDVAEIAQVRLALEPLAVGLAAERIAAPVLDRLHALVARMDQARERDAGPDVAAIHRLNHEFHRTVVAECGNARLVALVSQVSEPPLSMRALSHFDRAEMARSNAHHRELVQALAARSGPWAEAVMRTHLLAAHSALTRTGRSARTPSEQHRLDLEGDLDA